MFNLKNKKKSKGLSIELILKNKKEELFLSSYNCDSITETPLTENELYQKYKENILPFFNYYHSVMGEPSFELTNETRAMLGHLVDYRLKDDPLKKNLEKAYGHLRRLSLDISKILCDEYDKIFSKVIYGLHKYDFRNNSSDFLKDYLKLYNDSQEKYLLAQNEERLGSNNKIVYVRYFEAIQAYINLKNFYLKEKAIIEKSRTRILAGKVISISLTIGLLIINIITLL